MLTNRSILEGLQIVAKHWEPQYRLLLFYTDQFLESKQIYLTVYMKQ